MTEQNILDLYFERDGNAIYETDLKYGNYCYAVAYNILLDNEDSEESVNDTYLETWNRIPPTRPNSLKAYLGKLCRNISISRFRNKSTQKRGGNEVSLCLDELSECIPSGLDLQRSLETKELVDLLNHFLFNLPDRERNIFTARYWYAMATPEISRAFGINENTVKTILRRTRKALLETMKKEGWR